jgi:alkyl hydroperoxide reductase subunit F
MTAAVYAARQKAKTLLLARDVGGQLSWTLGIENYMGYQFIEGIELIRKFEEQVRKFPIDIKIGRAVESVIRVRDGFEVGDVDGTKYLGRTAIICSGKRPRMLNVPGEEMLRGRGLTYCEVCDGPLFQDMDVAVIGGGNSALEAAIDMTKIARRIYLVSLTPLTGDNILREKATEASNITIMTEHQTMEVVGDRMVSGIRVKEMKSGREQMLEVGGVFVEVGLIPNSDFVRGMLTLNEFGEILINCACETGVPGLYAAGDVTNVPAKQIVVAAGEGAKAALQAHQYLQKCL